MSTKDTGFSTLKRIFIIVLVIFFLAMVVLTTFLLCRQYLPMKERNLSGDVYASEPKQFSTKNEVNSFISSLFEFNSARSSLDFWDLGIVLGPQKSMDAAPDATMMQEDSPAQQNGSSHSQTNVQVSGIDESDVVKTNGKYIYKLSYKGLAILEVLNDSLIVKKEIEIGSNGRTTGEMILYGNKLIISSDRIVFLDEDGKIADDGGGRYSNIVDTRIYNVEDAGNPVLEKQMIYTGSRVDMRLKDNMLYFIINYSSYSYYTDKDFVNLPKEYIGDGDEVKVAEKPLDEIYYFDGIPYYTYSIVGKINLDTNEVSSVSYFGTGETVYMSHNYLYLTSTDYNKAVYNNGLRQEVEYGKNHTRILRIKLDDLNLAGVSKVEGSILNKYSMDEYDGYLRLATTTSSYGWNFESYSNVFILDSNLREVGKITNIAPGEKIYSARFDKEEGAIVTFRQVDPLYKLNLSDPANPTISEGLKKDGVAYYLHKVNDKYMVGVGRETTADSFFDGIEVVLYNMEGAEAVISHKIVIGEGLTYADALYDPHAFLVDLDNNLFGFDITRYQYQTIEPDNPDGDNVTSYYSYSARRDFFVFNFYEDEKGVGKIKIAKALEVKDEYAPIRGLRIDQKLYVIEDTETKVYDIAADYELLYKAKYFVEEVVG